MPFEWFPQVLEHPLESLECSIEGCLVYWLHSIVILCLEKFSFLLIIKTSECIFKVSVILFVKVSDTDDKELPLSFLKCTIILAT